MTTADIYDTYRINKGLREHMVRVASVMQMMCDASQIPLEEKRLITASLVHDLGNIVKVKFETLPELFEPEGVEYYKNVQKEVIQKYGSDDHDVTTAMILEAGIDREVLSILEGTEMTEIQKTAEFGSVSQKMMMYADLRVGMKGVVTIDARFDDLIIRAVPHRYSEEMVESGRRTMKKVELEIFSYLEIAPEDITDEVTGEIQEKLWGRELMS